MRRVLSLVTGGLLLMVVGLALGGCESAPPKSADEVRDEAATMAGSGGGGGSRDNGPAREADAFADRTDREWINQKALSDDEQRQRDEWWAQHADPEDQGQGDAPNKRGRNRNRGN